MNTIGVLCVGLASSSSFGQVATFTVLRNTTYPFLGMDRPLAMSADGRVVAGAYGLRWTREAGVVPSGFIPPGTTHIRNAWALNFDGSVEVGTPYPGTPGGGDRYWTTPASTTVVTSPPLIQFVVPFGRPAMTDDGQWFLGWVPGNWRSARVHRSGHFELLPIDLFGTERAYSISGDGRVIVGSGTNQGGDVGLVWTLASGSASNAVLVGVANTPLAAVSGDGAFAVGVRPSDARGNLGALVTIGAGVELFCPPLGFVAVDATAVSDGGALVVGGTAGSFGESMFVRRRGEQARDLRIVLQRFGVPEVAFHRFPYSPGAAVSRDGKTVCGTSASPWYGGWAFVATLPEWQPCPADLNFDGVVDDLDFSIFAGAYDRLMTTDGDLNVDRFTDDADFSHFAVAYDALLCP